MTMNNSMVSPPLAINLYKTILVGMYSFTIMNA